MALVFNGTTNVISGVAVGGLPDGIVDTDMLAANAVSSAKLASGAGGKILQVVQTVKTDITSFSVDAGSLGTTDSTFNISITPSNTSSLIYLSGFINLAVSGGVSNVCIVYRRGGSTLSTAVNGGSTTTPIGDAAGSRKRVTSSGNNTNPAGNCFTLALLDKPNSTSAQTYSLGCGHGSSSTRTMYINEVNGTVDSSSFQRAASVFIAMEVAA